MQLVVGIGQLCFAQKPGRTYFRSENPCLELALVIL